MKIVWFKMDFKKCINSNVRTTTMRKIIRSSNKSIDSGSTNKNSRSYLTEFNGLQMCSIPICVVTVLQLHSLLLEHDDTDNNTKLASYWKYFFEEIFFIVLLCENKCSFVEEIKSWTEKSYYTINNVYILKWKISQMKYVHLLVN